MKHPDGCRIRYRTRVQTYIWEQVRQMTFTARFRAATSLVKRSPKAVGGRTLRLGMHAAQLTDCQRQAASGTVNLMGIRDDELMNIKDERFASVSECSVRLAKDEEERDFA